MRGHVPGRTFGRVPPGPVDPPPALPAVPVPVRERAGSAGQPWAEVVRSMVVAFKEATGGRNMRPLLERIDGPWRPIVKQVAGLLMDEGMSGAAYVAFVCARVRAKRGRVPYPAEVFSLKSAEGWMREYRADAAGWLPAAGYQATPERRAEHEARWRATT
jgi:hypothetical protein